MGRWQMHYPLGRIREHVWQEAGKTPEEMEKMPGFFDIAYEPSPFLKRVADLWRQSRARPIRRGAPARRNRYHRQKRSRFRQ
jgi:hypothetical protein